MSDIPGAYPATPGETTPAATPAAVPEPVAQHHRHSHRHHEHPERNKLHKSSDPRSHQYTDSGVGLTEPAQGHPFKFDDHKAPPLDESAGSGSWARDTSLPADTIDSKVIASSSPQDANYTLAGQADRNEASKAKVGIDGANRDRVESSAPYWGNLPKALTGGIYNTVMGHGSASDDHAQHHHLPARSAPERAHVAGITTDHPRGGVYNTVAGHGSQDEESKRHALSHDDAHAVGTHPSTDAILAAPLLDIKEEKEKPSGVSAMETSTSGQADGLFPETTAMDDTTFLGSVADGAADRKVSSPQDLGTSHPMDEPYGRKSTSPRAFPLTSSRGSSDKERQESDSHAKDALLAAAAGGAGVVAASERKDKPNKLTKPKKDSGSTKSSQRSNDSEADKAASGVLSHRPREEKDTSPSERRSSDEVSSNSEKKHHKILGIFHRRKESKSEREHKRDSVQTQPGDDDATAHHRHEKEAAAAAATGAGAYGLHHYREEKKTKDQRSSSEPAKPQPETRGHSKRMSANDTSTGPTTESRREFGVMHWKPEETNTEARNRDIHDSSAPPPPARSPKRRSLSPATSATMADESSSRQTSEAGQSRDASRHQSRSSLDAAKYAGVGAAAGLGASAFAGGHQRSAGSSVDQTSGTVSPRTMASVSSQFENPRELPSTPSVSATATSSKKRSNAARTSASNSPLVTTNPVVTNEPGNYTTLASGTASGVRASSAKNPSTDSTAHDTFDYNVLTSGTSSGVKPTTSHHGRTSSSHRRSGSAVSDDSVHYNRLRSGTFSGVKIESESPRSNFVAEQYNTLASGTASGIDTIHQERMRPESEMRAAPCTLVAAPIPSHVHDAAKARAKSEPHSQLPHETANKVGPESAPDSHRTHSQSPSHPSRDAAKDMSPEVIPDSCRAQSHPLPTASADTSSASQQKRHDSPQLPTAREAEQFNSPPLSNADPALAAATGAWASSAGPSSGAVKVGNHGKMIHKCQHCGGDNDISSYFTEENAEKIRPKENGAAGSNWWRSAWTTV